jgi:hypothetical protein
MAEASSSNIEQDDYHDELESKFKLGEKKTIEEYMKLGTCILIHSLHPAVDNPAFNQCYILSLVS